MEYINNELNVVETENPGEPPAEVINGKSTDKENNSVQIKSSTNMEETDNGNGFKDEKRSADCINGRR